MANATPAPRKRGIPWGFVLKKTFREFSSDNCTDLAAALTYFGVLALFPALLALVSILGLIGQGEQGIAALLEIAKQVAPGTAITLIKGPIEQFASTPAVGWGVAIGLVGAIWSASGFVGAFRRAINRIYNVGEGRSGIQLRIVQLLVTIAVLVLVVVMALILVLSGPVAEAVGNVVGLGATAQLVWSIVKWPVLVIALVLMVAILYSATPNVKRPRFRIMSIGAFSAVIILGIASVGFGFYVANFSHYNKTYGSLAGVIIFLLWVWIANLALLFGAELDVEVERGRELAAGKAAEVSLLLPLKSDKALIKAADKRDKTILDARRIREADAVTVSKKDPHKNSKQPAKASR